MARIAKNTKPAADATKPAAKKVGKLDKSAAKPAAKPAKEKADKAPAAPRGEYANRTYRVTEAGKAANPRGLRGARWAIVKAAKNTADFLGKPYTGPDGSEHAFSSAKLANFVERGFIEFV